MNYIYKRKVKLIHLRARHRHLAGGEFVEDLAEALSGQVLVIVLADLRHRRIRASAQTFDLFPREFAVGGDLMRLGGDLVLADRDQILGAADHAGRGAADLNMRDGAHRLKLEHEVECGDFQGPDIGQIQQIGAIFDGRSRQPAFLFLRAPVYAGPIRYAPVTRAAMPSAAAADLRTDPSRCSLSAQLTLRHAVHVRPFVVPLHVPP